MLESSYLRQPPKEVCPEAKTVLAIQRGHAWEFSTSWNGMVASILPWVKSRSGIPRAGWRCARCGKKHWAQTDAAFAEAYAMATNPSVKFALNQLRGLDRWGREMSRYTRSEVLAAKGFQVVQTSESITVKCGQEIVARWSSGDIKRDYDDFFLWVLITGISIDGLDDIQEPGA